MERKQDSCKDLLLVARQYEQNALPHISKMGESETTSSSLTRIRDKFRGCLLGALVGDCVGSLFERDYSVSYRVLQDLYHSLTNLSEDEKLMEMHDMELSLGSKRVRDILDTKRQSYASGTSVQLCQAGRNTESVVHLRRNSAFASGTQKVVPILACSKDGSKRGSRLMEKYSDDTVMTKSVLFSLIACKGFDARHLAKQLTVDYFLNMNRKYSGYIRDVFVQLRGNGYQDPYAPAKKCSGGIGAQGNEAACRVSPIALFCSWGLQQNQYQVLVELAGKNAKITNAQRTSVHGTVLQALAIFEAFNWEYSGEREGCRKCGNVSSSCDQTAGLVPGETLGTSASCSGSSRHASPLLMRRRGSLSVYPARQSLGEVSGTKILVEQQPKYFCERLLERMSCSVEGRPSLFENLKNLVHHSVSGNSKELLKPTEPTYCDKLRTILEFLQRSQPPTRIEVVERLGNGFKAIDSVPTAVYSFLFAAKNDMLPEMSTPIRSPILRTIFHAISLGGETDTLAGMAGAIAGAYWGSLHIPEEVLAVSEGSQEVIRLADELFNLIFKTKVSSSGGVLLCESCHQPYN